MSVKTRHPLQEQTTHVDKSNGEQYALLDNGTVMHYRGASWSVSLISACQLRLLRRYIDVTKPTKPEHNRTQAIMPILTAKDLTDKLEASEVQPEPPQCPLSQQIADLEAANRYAAEEIIHIRAAMNYRLLGSNATGQGVLIADKYQKRLQGILRDMIKDQEALLDETATALLKVQKVIG